MNVRRTIPIVIVAMSLTPAAFAQTATAPAPTPRPALATTVAPVAVAQPSAGVATTLAPAAQATRPTSGFATSFPQAPPVPPSPPAPPSPAAAPQAPQPPQAPPATRSTRGDMPVPAFAPRNKGQLVNLRLEFTVTDQIGSAPPVRKTITMNVADGESGRIRTNARVWRNKNQLQVPLSVDASPELEGSRIRLRASLEYLLVSDSATVELPSPDQTSITQGVTAILNDGVVTVLSQSADPLTDRKVTLEVKATIIK